MSRRFVDGLIVLWGITACLLVAGGRDLLAMPGDCDKDCRQVTTVGSLQAGKTVCKQYMFTDCGMCVANGCWSDLPKLGGKCQPNTTTQKEADGFTCAILCKNPAANVYYQADTNVTDFTYKDALKVNVCSPGGP